MRQIVLDTETTGLEPAAGHRIIEIGGVELQNRRLTGKTFHRYLNPERTIEAEAVNIHGITNEYISDKPKFVDIAEEFIEFIRNSEVIIHNAPFDTGFIDHEFGLLNSGLGKLTDYCTIIDTLVMARKRHPGQKNSLDALCKRYNIDNSRRDLHGALLDAEILAQVYLVMTGGQVSLLGDSGYGDAEGGAAHTIRRVRSDRPRLPVIQPTSEELAAHEEKLAVLDKLSGGTCPWRQEYA
jgi:DNA polymerase-3 subunit epsilon